MFIRGYRMFFTELIHLPDKPAGASPSFVCFPEGAPLGRGKKSAPIRLIRG
jgi:hypothetical protein